MISSEYGWTTGQILELTLREMQWRLLAITKRKNEALKQEAAMHDKEIKIPVPKKEQKTIEITEEQEKGIEEAFKKAKLRKANTWHKN